MLNDLRYRSSMALYAICLTSLFLSTGCGPNDRQINAFVHDWEASVAGTRYVVQPPDAIEINSAEVPEIDGEIQTIGTDGKISLRLIGEVKVAGLTVVEIARKLESILSKYYINPTVRVRLARQESKKIYVFGEVAGAGAHPFTGRDTVLSLLAKAQPFHTAWKSRIKVIHPSHDRKKRHIITVDAGKIMKEGNLEMNFLLEEGDIVYVPPTPLAWLGQKARELLSPVQAVTDVGVAPGETSLDYQYVYSNSSNTDGRSRSGRR